MLTKVILEGPLGKKFGREWMLEVSSVSEAFRLIDANKPGFFTWIRENLGTHPNYKIVSKSGTKEEEVGVEGLQLSRKADSIIVVPLLAGAGDNALQIVAGVALIAFAGPIGASIGVASGTVAGVGFSLAVGGVIASLTKTPTNGIQEQQERKDKTSYYFNGPINTTLQGSPVQLIYGRCLVGSQVISAAVTIDQLL